jgi:hypothetical protein
MSDLIIEGGFAGGWLDTLVDFHFPSNTAVLTFDLSNFGASNYADTPQVTIVGQGGGAQMSILAGGTQLRNKAVTIAAFPPFNKQDTTTITAPKFWDYTTETFVWGLRGSSYPFGEVIAHGANSSACFDDGVNQIVAFLAGRFGWDRPKSLSEMVGVTGLYDFFVFLGFITDLHLPAPGQNPAAPQPPAGNFDFNAVTVLRGGEQHTSIQDWRNSALVIPLSPYRGLGNTVSISMTIKGPPANYTLSWAAGCATYKAPAKGWHTSPPAGWNIGPQTYPTYATYPWHRTQGYDAPLLGKPKGAVDSKEIHSAPVTGGDTGAPPAPRSIKFTIDTKTLRITPSG